MVIRAMMVQPMRTSIGRDAVTNSWHMKTKSGTTLDQPTAQAFVDAAKLVYDSMGNYRSTDVQLSAAHWVFYDLSQLPPRAPLFDLPAGLSTAQPTTTLPHELSLCMSYQAVRTSGLPQARRRGRIYFGPFAAVATDNVVGRPASAMRSGLVTAMQTFIATSKLTVTTWEWLVYSPTGEKGGSSTPYAKVDNGWVDDEWDIQRRRGLVPTTRATFA